MHFSIPVRFLTDHLSMIWTSNRTKSFRKAAERSGISRLLLSPAHLVEDKITKSEEVAQKLNICGFPL